MFCDRKLKFTPAALLGASKFWKRSLFPAALLYVFSFSFSSFAATDGTLGSTSTGRVEITLNLTPLVKISQLQDIDLGEWQGEGDLVASIEFCVWSNQGTDGGYAFQASGTENGFSLSNGVETVPMEVSYSTFKDGASELYPLQSGQSVGGMSANGVNVTCDDGTQQNAGLLVRVAEEQMQTVKNREEPLTGVLSLLVLPE